MTTRTITICLAGLLLISCSNGPATTNSNANTNTSNAANQPANTANAVNATDSANTSNSNSNKPANAPANAAVAKPAASGPKRIAFAAGKSEGTESISLPAGGSTQFVVGAKTAQIFMVDADSKDVTFSMVKGKVAQDATMSEPGHYDTTLLENGDFVFEVKNTSKNEVKTKITVIVSHTAHSK